MSRFWFTLNIVTLVLDAAWWMMAMHLTRRRLWRALVSVFIGGHVVLLFSLMGGLAWVRGLPQGILVSITVWNCGVLVLGLAVLLPMGLARLRARDNPIVPPAGADSQTRREFISACAALAPPLFSAGLTGVALADLDHLRVRRFTLSVPALPRDLDGVTIAHLSDMHVGGFTSGRILREMVNTTNALRPDLVLLTGDLIHYPLSDLSEGISLVKAMEGRYGLWMIEGNHDVMDNGEEFGRRVKAAGVPLLRDESAVAIVRSYPVQLFGLTWRGDTAGHRRDRDRVTSLQVDALMERRQPDAFPILLAHHPHAFDAALKAGLPLTLSGHTHGGFWMLNDHVGIGPAAFRYWSGLYQRSGGQLIVSNGIGNWKVLPPIRINAPAEIVHITLRCATTGSLPRRNQTAGRSDLWRT